MTGASRVRFATIFRATQASYRGRESAGIASISMYRQATRESGCSLILTARWPTPSVWLNGQYVGTWPYGYQPFRLELTPFVKFGAENVLAVRLDTAQWGSRWYPGAGIYRNVWIVKTSPVHVGHWGVYITTPSLTDREGKARVVVTVDNQGRRGRPDVSIQTEIFELAADGDSRG